jgi:endoglucanase
MMPRLAVVLILLLCAASPAAAAPALRISGRSFVDGHGHRIRLLGVNRSGAEYACAQGWGFFDGPTGDASIAAMARWHIDAVRLPLNEACWLALPGSPRRFSGRAYRSQIAAYVTRLHRRRLAVILDLHWSTAGGSGATGQQQMADAAHAVDFWRSVAARFRRDRGVVFDLYNEPHDIGWSCWRDGCTTASGWRAAGMQELLDAVRAAGARQPVIATADGWGNDAAGWLAHRPRDPLGQLAAGVHVYSFNACADPRCWDRTIAPLAHSVPVVTAELGENDCGPSFIDRYMGWADRSGISYLGWTWDTWDCSAGPALISAYDGTPTPFGRGLRDHLAGLAQHRRK